EKAQLRECLLADSHRPILVQGGAGFGKTTLTTAVLHEPPVQARFALRTFFVRCEAARSAAAVLDHLAGVFGITGAADTRSALLGRLQRLAPLVLVLDNAETPWHGDRRA